MEERGGGGGGGVCPVRIRATDQGPSSLASVRPAANSPAGCSPFKVLAHVTPDPSHLRRCLLNLRVHNFPEANDHFLIRQVLGVPCDAPLAAL